MFVKWDKRKHLGFGIVLSIRNTEVGSTYLSIGLGRYSFVVGYMINI